ncbi:MAG: ABC transporter ATP-binding protein [Ruminococcaceae bacterium]|nr:ABC transporter ATP-binding protein [Oscillospiraceae bacterium]
MNVIKTQGLTKFYGRSRGIERVDLNIKEGDFYGFIGPNGAGKSTTIRLLLGLINKDSGKAEIFGKDIEKHKTELLSDIGYLPSETSFYSGMKVKEMLDFAARMRNKDCSADAVELCERLELDPDKRIEQLSFGNRKKVGIVCALQHSPRLYILDEPTSGLDPLMQREFYEILKERNEKGATVFLSSHILSEVSRYCKNAAVIRRGTILLSDSIENLAHTGVKRVVLRGIKQELEIENARDIKYENETLNFLYSGEIKELLLRLNSISFEDINITDPELDEIFMHYYVKEEN